MRPPRRRRPASPSPKTGTLSNRKPRFRSSSALTKRILARLPAAIRMAEWHGAALGAGSPAVRFCPAAVQRRSLAGGLRLNWRHFGPIHCSKYIAYRPISVTVQFTGPSEPNTSFAGSSPRSPPLTPISPTSGEHEDDGATTSHTHSPYTTRPSTSPRFLCSPFRRQPEICLAAGRQFRQVPQVSDSSRVSSNPSTPLSRSVPHPRSPPPRRGLFG
jgi:hypothetical protein